MSLYHLKIGLLGEVILTSNGELGSEMENDGHAYIGLSFDVRVEIPKGKKDAYIKVSDWNDNGKLTMPLGILAVWDSRGRKPRWITGSLIDKNNGTYRKAIAEWLKTKGTPEEVIQKTVVEQIVQADINGDGRNEIFLSFHSLDTPTSKFHDKPTKRTFSYLVMRYSPLGRKEVKIAVLEDFVDNAYEVSGFCDLDGDGWAEVIAQRGGVDMWGVDLYHWTGAKFKTVQGWGGGA